jgi:hypothetical protein
MDPVWFFCTAGSTTFTVSSIVPFAPRSPAYEHRTVKGGIAHDLPQEPSQAFAQAVIDVARG